MQDEVELAGEAFLNHLNSRMTELNRLCRRCEAHGALRSMEALRPQIEELQAAIDVENQIFSLVMANR